MRVTRSFFELRKYPERFLEFKRLMAFCDGNNLQMFFYEDIETMGINVYDAYNEAVTAYNNYTMYYSTIDRKIHFLCSGNWIEGFAQLLERLTKAATRVAAENDECVTPFNVDLKYLMAQYEKKKKEQEKKLEQFDFEIVYDGYTENVAVFDESIWLAKAQMRQLYPGKEFYLA